MKNNFIIYQNLNTTTIKNVMNIVNEYRSQDDKIKKLSYQVINDLLNFAHQYTISNNIWKMYLSFLMIHDENPFSLYYERQTLNDHHSLDQLVSNDFKIIQELYSIDFELIAKTLQIDALTIINNYQQPNTSMINQLLLDLTNKIDQHNDFISIFKTFYQQYGVGNYGLYKAFKITEKNNLIQIQPIENVKEITFNDLIGYDLQKEKLKRNTQAFIENKKANNVLLFGDSGTGKSSSIKAIINEYYQEGLRMIEIYKHQFPYLTEIISTLSKRNYKFIIYMDDLSFEDTEIEFKYLKAIIEGDLEETPQNVLIYATSNRRHLIKEVTSDNQENDDDLHRFDTKQEKLSLSQRFGISIYYGKPDKDLYQKIIKQLTIKHHIHLDEETLLKEANQWELYHGGMNGRNAEQFIYHLLSTYQ